MNVGESAVCGSRWGESRGVISLEVSKGQRVYVVVREERMKGAWFDVT